MANVEQIREQTNAIMNETQLGSISAQRLGIVLNLLLDLAAEKVSADDLLLAIQDEASLRSSADNAIELDVAGIISDLANYYKKTETFSRTEIINMLAQIKATHFVTVDTLPIASEETVGKIYLIPSSTSQVANAKEEYITVFENQAYRWEHIGSTNIDLSGYSTTEQMNEAISSAISTLSDAVETEMRKRPVKVEIPTSSGDSVTLPAHGYVYSWNGKPVAEFQRVYQSDESSNYYIYFAARNYATGELETVIKCTETDNQISYAGRYTSANFPEIVKEIFGVGKTSKVLYQDFKSPSATLPSGGSYFSKLNYNNSVMLAPAHIGVYSDAQQTLKVGFGYIEDTGELEEDPWIWKVDIFKNYRAGGLKYEKTITSSTAASSLTTEDRGILRDMGYDVGYLKNLTVNATNIVDAINKVYREARQKTLFVFFGSEDAICETVETYNSHQYDANEVTVYYNNVPLAEGYVIYEHHDAGANAKPLDSLICVIEFDDGTISALAYSSLSDMDLITEEEFNAIFD